MASSSKDARDEIEDTDGEVDDADDGFRYGNIPRFRYISAGLSSFSRCSRSQPWQHQRVFGLSGIIFRLGESPGFQIPAKDRVPYRPMQWGFTNFPSQFSHVKSPRWTERRAEQPKGSLDAQSCVSLRHMTPLRLGWVILGSMMACVMNQKQIKSATFWFCCRSRRNGIHQYTCTRYY